MFDASIRHQIDPTSLATPIMQIEQESDHADGQNHEQDE
jgi:hypothetical protein